MDLSSASTYLNNLLVKGGLLKGGMTVPFHNPSAEDGSITRIINLIHDLVMRREVQSPPQACVEIRARGGELTDRFNLREKKSSLRV